MGDGETVIQIIGGVVIVGGIGLFVRNNMRAYRDNGRNDGTFSNAWWTGRKSGRGATDDVVARWTWSHQRHRIRRDLGPGTGRGLVTSGWAGAHLRAVSAPRSRGGAEHSRGPTCEATGWAD